MTVPPYIELQMGQDLPSGLETETPDVRTVAGPNDALAYCRAEHVTRSRDWTGMCLAFARSAWGVPALYGSATAAWNASFLKLPGETDPPPGSPIWWTGGAKGFGHVAIYVGEGDIWSSDILRTGQVDLAPLGRVAAAWGLRYVGATRDINGVAVMPPHPIAQVVRRLDGADRAWLADGFVAAVSDA